MSIGGALPTVEVPIGLRIGGPGGYEVIGLVASGAWGSVYAGHRLASRSGSARRAGPLDNGPLDDGVPDKGVPDGGVPDGGVRDDGVLGDGVPGDRGGDGEVALKFLAPGAATPHLARVLSETVRREVASRDALHHPRLVRLYEVLTLDDVPVVDLQGAVVLVMELADASLDELLNRHRAGLPAAEATARLVEIAEALGYVHGAGWVHGDLKPSNVLLRRDGTCCLTDFGLAGLLEGTHAYVPPLATPDYAPPERREAVASADGQQVRASGDIWALGVIACRLLTGSMPLPGETAWARAQAAAEYARGDRALALPDSLAEPWRRLVEDCLAADPADRPDAATVLRRLNGLRDVAVRREVPPRVRWRWWHGLVALTALLGSALLGWALAVVHYGPRLAGDPVEPAMSVTEPAGRPGAGTPDAEGLPAVASGTCQLRDTTVIDESVSSFTWSRVWYCVNDLPTVLYSGVDGQTPVALLLTSTSWFTCYREGPGGDVWYYTQGDDSVAGWEGRGAWGFASADVLHVDQNPYPGVPMCPETV
jgi:serine/threonine protein kinase